MAERSEASGAISGDLGTTADAEGTYASGQTGLHSVDPTCNIPKPEQHPRGLASLASMTACERCLSLARLLGIEYTEQLLRAEQHNEPCTANTPAGAKLRAGQFWDDARACDTRFPITASHEG